MVTTKKQKLVGRKVGDILLIDLGSGRYAYAQVGEEPLVIFFEGTFDEEVAIEHIPDVPVAFRL